MSPAALCSRMLRVLTNFEYRAGTLDMEGKPDWIQKSLAEEMWILSSQTGPKNVEPWIQKNCATVFSSKEAAVAFGMAVKVSKDKGFFNVKGWDELLKFFEGLKGAGCTLVAIDPLSEVVTPQRIDEVIGAVRDVVNGQRGFGLHPN